MARITIEGNQVRAVSPEGQTACMAVEDLFRQAAGPRMTTCGMYLPNGIRWMESSGPLNVWVCETPPRMYRFKWIDNDSPIGFGPGTKYRTVRIALPYLIVVAVFEQGVVSDVNECFFRTAPLNDGDEDLFYPALLNCSKFEPPEGRPLSWICTQKLDRGPLARCRNPAQQMCRGFNLLAQCLLETGFNYSSEHHEFSSWFTESTRVDPRIATVENWEQATAADPQFVLDVPWLPTGKTVPQVVERIFDNHGADRGCITTAGDVARLVFNNHKEAP